MVEPSDLRDLPPDRFGDVVAAVVADAWDGEATVSPPSPDGAVEAVIVDDDGRRLVRFAGGTRVDADEVRDAAAVRTARGFDAATLVSPGAVIEAAREAADELDVTLLDGEALASMVEAAGASLEEGPRPPVASVVRQLAGHWPERVREAAVDLATTVEGVGPFDRTLTRAPGLSDLDFRDAESGRLAVRMRFTRDSLLVYVRAEHGMESVVRLTAQGESQPPVGTMEADLLAALEAAGME